MKKKKIIIIVVILIVLLFPIRNQLKDGGTVEYKSLTYSISKVHSLYSIGGYEMGYKDGIIIKLFNITIYNNTKNSLNEKFVIVDTSKDIKDFSCDQALEEIYRDDKYIYYLPCIKSLYIKVIYASNNYQEGLKSSLEEGKIKINDLDKFDIEYIKQEKESINEVTEISLEEKAWINSLTKINIKNTNDYFTITKKVKWEVPEHSEDTTISFSIPIPYTFVVNGKSYNGIYELNDAVQSKKEEGLAYNLKVVNLTKDGKIEIEVTK